MTSKTRDFKKWHFISEDKHLTAWAFTLKDALEQLVKQGNKVSALNATRVYSEEA